MSKVYPFMVSASLLFLGCTANERTTTTVSETSGNGERVTVTETTVEQKETPPVTADDVAMKTREAVDVAGEFAAQTKEEFVAEAQDRLAQIDAKIKEWDAKSETLQAEAKTRWHEEREKLRQQQAKLQLEIEKLQNATGEAWLDVKAGATAAWKELANGFSAAATRFEEDPPQGTAP